MALKKTKVQGIWSSRWTFLAAATGLVVSLGNFWTTPQEAAAQGGAVYLLLYAGFLLLVMLPVAVAELRIAMRARANPIHAVDQIASFSGASRHWSLVAQLSAVAALLLAANLSVVSSWLFWYIPKMSSGAMEAASLDLVAAEFQQLLASPEMQQQSLYGFLVLTIALSSVSVKRGMAIVLRILLPVLLLVMAGLLYFAYELGDFGAAERALFTFRATEFSWEAVLSAAQNAFFALGLGSVALMAYGAYFPSGRSASRQLLALAGIDTAAMLMGGLIIIALVSDQHIVAGQGPALMFVSLPYSFGNLVFGDIAGTAFYILMGILAITTVVALFEPVVAYLVERWSLPRWLAALVTGGTVLLVAEIALLSLQPGSPLNWFSRSAMEWLDIVVANVLMPMCALCFVLFAGWRVPLSVYGVRDRWLEKGFFWLWLRMLRYIAPPVLLCLLCWGLYSRLT
ncbi:MULTISPECIES: sodium-dependent transporter [Spongiibacter]|uniref:sodium-dependent transporter n=1 Tax=Spongiibacter TaxID=630749 RepID=UPI000C4FDAB1|nr:MULTISPECIES: sodium-dependent transporter [Spongiibacter]MAY38917.1 sodium-dependent transporter [Spongiibacter sp.]MBI56967.1 sodium-dependent transporter [Spongiibacter sp.]|tara:strand:+ start:317 stop:1684 length:1368 start_codon:yes stop_codon:yes gene_type:complete